VRASPALLALLGCGRVGFGDGSAGGDGGGGGGGTLTVVVDGDGAGTITSIPPGIACPGTCEATFSTARVTLTATPSGDSSFGGWSRPGCTNTVCAIDLALSASVTARFTAPRNIIFVSSRSQNAGSFGGVAGADQLCATLAAQASLSGTYVALLSTTTMSVTARLGTARGWIRADGLPVADTAADLVGGRHFYPPNLDESGFRMNDDLRALTGTSGGVAGSTCANYTDTTAGNANASLIHVGGSTFMDNTLVSCGGASHVYCAGTSYTAPVTILPQQGAIAFAAPFSPVSGGLAGADAACNTAASGKLPGTFVALLASSSSSAASRITANPAGWVRPDGVAVAATFNDFIAGKLIAPISVDATGNPVSAREAWTGAAEVTVLGTTTCADWTSPSMVASKGNLSADATFFRNGSGSSCNQNMMLYCLQQ